MKRLPSAVLTDPAYRVPSCPGGESGLAWLRARVVRFSEGEEHTRRRALTETLIEAISDAPFVGTPTRSLLAALGLPAELETDVATVAAAYQPHAPQSRNADAAADRLLHAFGGRSESAAARVCVLVQAHAGTLALIETIRAASSEPPIPVTRRVGPDGTEVEVDLADAHFGRGMHRCPGETLARRLARSAVA